MNRRGFIANMASGICGLVAGQAVRVEAVEARIETQPMRILTFGPDVVLDSIAIVNHPPFRLIPNIYGPPSLQLIERRFTKIRLDLSCEHRLSDQFMREVNAQFSR